MVFSDPNFLFFLLPLALVSIYLSGRKLFCTAIVFWSFLFYFWGSEEDIFLLIFSATFNWIAGFSAKNKNFLFFAIFINLVLLFYYKYAFFVLSNFEFFGELSVVKTNLGALAELSLPTGISFFTFQAISYLIDIYRGDTKVAKNPLQFFAYLSFFPQLIAGPIVRYQDVVEDLESPKRSLSNISDGMTRFAHGLLKKVLIADTTGQIADFVFALEAQTQSSSLVWIGVFAYSFQIYFDFSGYSDMAIGIGKILGIRIKENFNRPYSASSITEFWRRWHISLSMWFRDYLYIPLGGNRRGPYRTIVNLSLVFLLCGLWHGAAYTFLIWGAFHGFFLGVERIAENFGLFRTKTELIGVSGSIFRDQLRRFLYFIPLTLISWTLFRAESIEQFSFFIKKMLDSLLPIVDTPSAQEIAFRESSWNAFLFKFGPAELLIFALSFLVFLIPRKWAFNTFLEMKKGRGLEIVKIAYGILALIIAIVSALTTDYSSFLYFRF